MKFIGNKCPFCENIIEENDDIVICSRCETPHHRDCWKANQGCMTYSCYGDMLTPKDFEEPEFYKKRADNISDEDMEVKKADGSQFAEFYGGNDESDGIFQGVLFNSTQNLTSNENKTNQSLSAIFPKKTEAQIKEELRAKIKDEIKAELKDEIKAKTVTSLICERCGATLPISRNRGIIVCKSCLTEYIFNEDSSKRILKEINNETPFFLGIVDPELSEIKDIIDTGKDYNYAYQKLLGLRKSSFMKYGYWFLRLRAYTEDFNIVNSDIDYYNEIFDCIKEHIKLFPLNEEEKILIDGYFDLNNYALNFKLKELQAECENLEKKVATLKKDEKNINVNINGIRVFIDNPEAMSNYLRKKHEDVYSRITLYSYCVLAFGTIILFSFTSIIFIPVGILCFFLAIPCSIVLFVSNSKKKKIEEEFRIDISSQMDLFENQRSKVLKDLDEIQLDLDRRRFECKKISEILSFKVSDLHK